MAEDDRSDSGSAGQPSGSDRVRYRHDRRESTFSLPVFLGSFVIVLALVAAVIFLALPPGQYVPPSAPAPERADTSGSVAAGPRTEAPGLEAKEERNEQRIGDEKRRASETSDVTHPKAGAGSSPSGSAPLVGKKETGAASVVAGDSVVGPAPQSDRGDQHGADRKSGATRDRPGLRGRRGAAPAGADERWWLGPIGVTVDLFLLDRRDESGERHLFRAAAPGERFVFVEFPMAWRGEKPRECVIRPAGAKQPTVRLFSGPRGFDPLGLMASGAEPLRPLGPPSMKIQPHKQVTINLVFVVPEDLKAVDLSAEGLPSLTLALPPADRLEAGSLVGRWRRVDELYRPMRSGSALIDAIGRPGGRVAQMSLGSRGSLQLELPGAGIVGRGVPAHSATGTSSSMSLTLVREDERQPCVLRATADSRVLLLYAGDAPQTVFVYERSDP